VRHQPTDRQNEQREQNPGFELRDFEAVRESVEDVAKHGERNETLLTRLCRFRADDFAGTTFGFDLGFGGRTERVRADRKFLC